MTAAGHDLEQRLISLLQDSATDNPLHQPLAELWQAHQDLVYRLERITRISDAYQSLAKEREVSLVSRVDKQLRQLEKIVRISDRYQHMMRDLNIALQEAASHDVLTGLPNRRLLTERLREASELHRRYGRPFSLAMIDIDHFKSINDRFGHETGDSVIIEVARVLDAEVREQDTCGRWGGEEFLLLLPETDAQAAALLGERLRHAIEQLAIRHKDEPIRVTASIGIAGHAGVSSYSETINHADNALLQAKRAGRNQCMAYTAARPIPS